MSGTVTVEQAQAKLKEIIDQLAAGEEIVITENEQPVAKLVSRAADAPAGTAISSGPWQRDDYDSFRG